MKWTITALLFAGTAAWACVSTTTRKIDMKIVEKNAQGEYIIEVTSQEFDNATKKPTSGETKFKFVENDFAAIYQIISTTISTNPEKEKAMSEPAIMAMQGYVDYLKKERQGVLNYMIASGKRLGRTAEESQKMLQDALAQMQTAVDKAKSGDYKDARSLFEQAKFRIGLNHTYNRVNGGPDVTWSEIFPPTYRGGCTGSESTFSGLDLLGKTGATPVKSPTIRDPLLGIGTGTSHR